MTGGGGSVDDINRYEALNLQQEESETDPFTLDRYAQFHRFFPKEVRGVLDVGCNTGRGGEVLKRSDGNLRITGLDCVQDRLDRLPTDVYDSVLNGLSTSIPCDDGTFDAIVAGEFIEHLYAPDVAASLAEFFRVLRVGGRLLLTTPNPSDLKRRLRGDSVLGGAHVSQHHASSLRQHVRMMGFSRVRIYGSGKTSRYLGSHFPVLALYGSYLLVGDKW
jgi:ubiquinone/menaquinone biosynthesis C-methylase UbiE